MKFKIKQLVSTKDNMLLEILNYHWIVHMDEYAYLCQCSKTGRIFEFLERDLKEIN